MVHETVKEQSQVDWDAVERENGRSSLSMVRMVKALRDDSITLIRQEVALLRAELSEKWSNTKSNLSFLAVGGVMAYTGAVFFLWGMILMFQSLLLLFGVAKALVVWFVPTAVGGGISALGLSLLRKGASRLGNEDLRPKQPLDSLNGNARPW